MEPGAAFSGRTGWPWRVPWGGIEPAEIQFKNWKVLPLNDQGPCDRSARFDYQTLRILFIERVVLRARLQIGDLGGRDKVTVIKRGPGS